MAPLRAPSARTVDEQPPPRFRPHEPSPDATAHASPARELQAGLINALEGVESEAIPRWSGAVRLAVIGGGSAALWAAVIGVTKLFL